MKQSPYFSHDADSADDPKIVRLLDELGPEGYGIFWLLVEVLRKQEPDYCYPVFLLPALSKRFNTTFEKVKAVVGSYDLFIITEDGKIFFSESLNERMKLMGEKREKYRNAGSLGGKQKALNVASLKQCYSDALPIKESKVNIKSKKKVKEKTDTLFSIPIEFQGLWEHWTSYRKNDLRKPYKTVRGEQEAFQELKSKSNNELALATTIVDYCIKKEWQSFTYWSAQSKNGNNGSNRSTGAKGGGKVNSAWVRPDSVPTVQN